ncbi:MAG TPA: hypothetical protein VEB60_03335 [Candidatus Paceibacterota bacterium]|nr:hypothetical protein [Candidatus Paceibacterota bacterium]
MLDSDRRNGLTFRQWLEQEESLPDGFRLWDGAYRHWDQSNPIEWAISRFQEEYVNPRKLANLPARGIQKYKNQFQEEDIVFFSHNELGRDEHLPTSGTAGIVVRSKAGDLRVDFESGDRGTIRRLVNPTELRAPA